MADREAFQTKLMEIQKLAVEKENKMTKAEIEGFFASDSLTEEQLKLVCEYLVSQKVIVEGYEIEMQEEAEKELDAEAKAYVEQYLSEVREMPETDSEQMAMKRYLEKVVEEAVKIYQEEIFIGDVIQEGSMSLVLAMSEGIKDEDSLLKAARAGMATLIESQEEEKAQDKKMIEKVADLDETIKHMTEEYGRKVAVDEVAEKLGISEEEIVDILKLAGEDAPEEEEV